MPKSNSQQKVPQTPASATSKWGLNGEEREALLRNKRLSNSREELAGCGPAHPPQEAGGGETGKLAPETASLTKLQTGLQFLTKDFLRFWMVSIHRKGRG